MDMDVLRKKLGDRHKLTMQREAVFLVMNQSAQGHMSPEELYSSTREKYPEVGLATVYRTLHLFEQVGLVKKVNIGNGRSLYELYKGVSPHHHMVCLQCGCVIDMRLPDSINQQAADASWEYGDFQPIEREVVVYGYCKDCLMKKEVHCYAREHEAQTERLD